MSNRTNLQRQRAGCRGFWGLLLGEALEDRCLLSASAEQNVSNLVAQVAGIGVDMQPAGSGATVAAAATSHLVHVAYLVPSDRTAQPAAVVSLQNSVHWFQEFFREQMDRNGFGPKTFQYETEADGVIPLIQVVHVSETDEYLRGDIWTRVNAAAVNAGLPIYDPGGKWLLVPEIHQEMSDGSIIGGVFLGGGGGSGSEPGVGMVGSDALALMKPQDLYDNRSYDGLIVPELGPFPMRFGETFAGFVGSTISEISSSFQGGALHELMHGFGLSHDWRNDANRFGNLMFNGLRGFRGWIDPQLFPSDETRLEYASALALNSNRYFNSDQTFTDETAPTISIATSDVVTPVNGLLNIAFSAFDAGGLSSALLVRNGDTIGELPLSGNQVNTAFQTAFYTPGANDRFEIQVFDLQGNRQKAESLVTSAAGFNRAAQPFFQAVPSVTSVGQSIMLDASGSSDPDGDSSQLRFEWDTNGDGIFDTAPSTTKTYTINATSAGAHLVRVRVTDAAGSQVVSTPIAVRFGEPSFDTPGFAVDAGQTSAKPNDDGRAVVIDPLGNSYVAGTLFYADGAGDATPNDGGQIFVAKYDAYGKLTWQHTIGSSADDRAYAIALDSTGDLYVTGAFQGTVDFNPSAVTTNLTSAGGFDVFVLKLNKSGTFQWARKVGGASSAADVGYAITVDAADQILITGQFGGTVDFDPRDGVQNLVSAGSSDVFVLKLDSQGRFVWADRMGGKGADRGTAITTDITNRVYTTGSFTGTADFDPGSGATNLSSAGGTDIFVSRLSATGGYSFAARMGGGAADEGHDIEVDFSGNIYTTGYFRGTADFNPGSATNNLTSASGTDVFLSKLTPSGGFAFAERVGGSGDDRGRGLLVESDGSIAIAGHFAGSVDFDPGNGIFKLSSAGATDAFIAHYAASGSLLDVRQFGGKGSDMGRAIARDSANNLYMTGLFSRTATFNTSDSLRSLTSQGGSDIFVVKVLQTMPIVLASAVMYPSGTGPFSVAVGDVNLDGKLDVATANAYDNSVSVLLGDGHGALRVKTDYAVGTLPYSVALADLNHDGSLDLIAANVEDHSVSVLLGRRDGTFEVKQDYPLGLRPWIQLALGDVNGDGNLDLAAGSVDEGKVSVLYGSPNGSFAPPHILAVSQPPHAVALGDLNGDGHLDLIAGGLSKISMLRGNGDGTFGTASSYAVLSQTFFLDLGDLNSDGRLDVVSANGPGDNLSVFLNLGNGKLGTRADYATGARTHSIKLADLNSDGKLDVVTANASIDSLSVFEGNGDGTFNPRTDYPVGSAPVTVAVGDLNGDRLLDVITGNTDASNLAVLLNQPVFSPLAAAVGNRSIAGALAGDSAIKIVTAAAAPRASDAHAAVTPAAADAVFGAIGNAATVQATSVPLVQLGPSLRRRSTPRTPRA